MSSMRMTLQKRSPAEPLSRVSSFAFCNDEQAPGHEDFSQTKKRKAPLRIPPPTRPSAKTRTAAPFKAATLALSSILTSLSFPSAPSISSWPAAASRYQVEHGACIHTMAPLHKSTFQSHRSIEGTKRAHPTMSGANMMRVQRLDPFM